MPPSLPPLSPEGTLRTTDLLDRAQTLFSASMPAERVPEDRLSEKHLLVFHYWQRKRGAGSVPLRSDIDPCDLRHALPNLILWEVDQADYRVRLAGTEVCTNMLGELKGVRLSEFRCPLLAETWTEFDAVRDGGLVSLVERTLHWLGRPLIFYRHLLLPLADESGRFHRLLSVMTFESTEQWQVYLSRQTDTPTNERWGVG
jgi:hypothetical protein